MKRCIGKSGKGPESFPPPPDAWNGKILPPSDTCGKALPLVCIQIFNLIALPFEEGL